jgi:hypothetical protein
LALLLPSAATGESLRHSAVDAPLEQSLCFEQTGFCVENPAFVRYFSDRGGVRIFGYPISREFTLNQFRVQLFQRVVLQLIGGEVARLNVLDTDVMPIRRASGSTFPGPDPSLTGTAPTQDDPQQYGPKVVQFINTYVPNRLPGGQQVGFLDLYLAPIPHPDPNMQRLLNLELWGLPTSRPVADPRNAGFIYQRFQRGIMHYRATCGCAEGILVGDYFKSVLTGKDLPPDLDEDMRGSRFYRQYRPGAVPGWVARPAALPGTDLTRAFGELLTGNILGRVSHVQVGSPPAQPVSGATVQVLGSPGTRTTGGDGRFAFDGIPRGTYQLWAWTSTWASDVQEIDLNGSQINIAIEARTADAAGQPEVFIGLVEGNSPVAGATVWILGTPFRTVSDQDGRFFLPYAPIDRVVNRTPTIVAAAGNRWGMIRSTGAAQSATVTLDRTDTPPQPPAVVYDFLTQAPKAQWRNGTDSQLNLFGLPNTDRRGFVQLLNRAQLEDGNVGANLLETHPEWIPKGRVAGTYPDQFTPGPGDVFQATVGLLQGAGAGNVTFRVAFVTRVGDPDLPGGLETTLASVQHSYDGRLVALVGTFPPEVQGRRGQLRLIVEAGDTSAQDWAVWINPQITRRA